MSRSLASGLFGGTLWAGAGRVFATLAAFALNIVLARLLEPADYGAYFIAVSLVTVAATIGLLGLDHAVVRLVSEALAQGRLQTMLRTIRTTLLLASAGAIAVSQLVVAVKKPLLERALKVEVLTPLAWILGLWIAAAVLQRAVAETFRGLQSIRLATIFGGVKNAGILSSVALLLGVGLLHLTGHASLSALLWLSALSTVALTAVAAVVLRSFLEDLSGSREWSDESPAAVAAARASVLMRIAGPMMAVAVLAAVRTNMDIWLVGAFGSNEEVALFGAAARLVVLVFVPLQIMNSSLMPLIAEADASGGRAQLERTLRVAATAAGLPALVVSVALAALATPILGAVFGDFYRAAAPLLLVLLAGHLTNVLAGPNMLALMMRGEQKAAMLGMLVTVAYIAVAGWFLAPRLGPLGVAVASATGLLLQNCIMAALTRWRLSVWTHIFFSPRAAWLGLQELRGSRSDRGS